MNETLHTIRFVCPCGNAETICVRYELVKDVSNGQFPCYTCREINNKQVRKEAMEINYNNMYLDYDYSCIDDNKVFGCNSCKGYFYAGKDYCKNCGFDLNCFNEPEEEPEEEEEEEKEESCCLCGKTYLWSSPERDYYDPHDPYPLAIKGTCCRECKYIAIMASKNNSDNQHFLEGCKMMGEDSRSHSVPPVSWENVCEYWKSSS
jgi:hypothetical protein